MAGVVRGVLALAAVAAGVAAASLGLGESGHGGLRFVQPASCSTFHGDVPLSVNVSFAHDLPAGECVLVHVRHSALKVWWFLTPPTPLKDAQYRFCVSQDLQLAGSLPLTPGYARLSAWWDQSRSSRAKPPLPAVALVAVLQKGEEQGDLPELARQGRAERDGHLLEDKEKAARLSARYGPLARHPWLQRATARTPGLLHPELLKALEDGSPRALWSVLEDAEEVLPCDEGPSATCSSGGCQSFLPTAADPKLLTWRDEEPIAPPIVYRVPLFTPEAAEMLLQELQAADASPLAGELTQPQNPENVGRAPGSPPGAVMLSEIGLGPLAASLVREVLGPLARLALPHWGGEALEAWQAFSLHRRVPSAEEQARLLRRHAETAGEGRIRADLANLGKSSKEVEELLERGEARGALLELAGAWVRQHGWVGADVESQLKRVCAGQDVGHTDVCELTLNICLGGNFTRSGVFFGGYSGLHELRPPPSWVAHRPGSAYLSSCQRMHDSVGPAEGARHSLVLRATSTAVRAAPAEAFAGRCLAP